MMKVNQLLLSFIFLFGFTHNIVQAASQAKIFLKDLWAVARNKTTVTAEQERMYRATLAGIDFADCIKGLLQEKEPSPFMGALSFLFEEETLSTTDVVTNTIKSQAQKNLEAFIEWYINRQVQHFITEINPNNLPITETQEKEIRAKEQFYRNAIEPATRLLTGKSTMLEKIGLKVAKMFAAILQKIRKWSGGEEIDVSWKATLQAEAEKAVEDGYNILSDWTETKLQEAIDGVKNAWNIVQQKTKDLTNAVSDAAKKAASDALETAKNNYNQLKDNMEKAMQEAQAETRQKWDEAKKLMQSVPDRVVKNIKKMAKIVKEYIFSSNSEEEEIEQYFETSEFKLTDLENFLHEAIIEKMKNAQNEDYAQIIEDALDRFKARLLKRELSEDTIDIIFKVLENELDYSVLRQADLLEFSKLTPELKNAILEAWKKAPKEDLIEIVKKFTQQSTSIDKELLKNIFENPAWQSCLPNELIQIPEVGYQFLSPDSLLKVKDALTKANTEQMDFDLINKLTALSLVENVQVETPQKTNDSSSILEKATAAKEQQAAKDAQLRTHTTITSDTQTTQSSTTSNLPTNQENSSYRPRSDSTASIYEETYQTPEEIENAQKKEELAKKAAEEKAAAEIEHTVTEYGI